jgi:hypothetical protein
MTCQNYLSISDNVNEVTEQLSDKGLSGNSTVWNIAVTTDVNGTIWIHRKIKVRVNLIHPAWYGIQSAPILLLT